MLFEDVSLDKLELLTLAMDSKRLSPGYQVPAVDDLHVLFPSEEFLGILTVFSPDTDRKRRIRGLGGSGGFCFEGNLLHCSKTS